VRVRAVAGVVQQELHRAEAGVVDGAGRGEGGAVHACQHLGVGARRRGLLEDLLVPALQGALPLEQVDERTVGVPGDLHLDVAAAAHETFAVHGRVPERGQRLASGSLDGRRQPVDAVHDTHAASAPAGRGLDEQGEAQVRGGVEPLLRVGGVQVQAGQHRDSGGGHELLGGDLAAHGADRRRRRPHPHQPGGLHRRGGVGILGEEAVARVDGVGPGALGRGQDGSDVEVGGRGCGAGQPDGDVALAHVRGVGVGVAEDADGLDAQAMGGTGDAAGDLAPVGDEKAAQSHGVTSGTGRRRRYRSLARSGPRPATAPARCGSLGGR
jgi:hypothetical protein